MKQKYRYAIERRFRRKGSPWIVAQYVDGWKGCEKSFLESVVDYDKKFPEYEWRLCRVTEIRTPVKEVACKRKK